MSKRLRADLPCDRCGGRTEVIETRGDTRRDRIRRRRQCVDCGRRFTTYERRAAMVRVL